MKTSSYFNSKVKRNFDKFFDKSFINRMARKKSFTVRKAQKITAAGFVFGFIASCCKGLYSYSQWAAEIGSISGEPVSKQALYKRVNHAETVAFAKELFMHALGQKIAAARKGALFSAFNRVLLQDSTTLSLPQCHAGAYPGNKSRGEQKAVARLQCLVNLKNMQWLSVVLQAFTNNDQSASKTSLPLLRKGDLLIRDLGYFVLGAFAQIEQQKAFYISRLRYGVSLYDTKGRLVNWKDLCRKKGIIDKIVLAGAEQKMRVRIVMVPLPAEQAAGKVRKAKKDRDKRLNHSKDYYLWLGYNVFITNVGDTVLSKAQVAEVYKVRWQVEILFKSWKSCFHLQAMLHERCTNIHRVETSIYLILMFCCLVVQNIYLPYSKRVSGLTEKNISLIKLCSYVCNNLVAIIQMSPTQIQNALEKNCCYEIRYDRINMTELIKNLDT